MHRPRIVADEDRRALKERRDLVDRSAEESRGRRSREVTSLRDKRRIRA
jgi:hypothetical protein